MKLTKRHDTRVVMAVAKLGTLSYPASISGTYYHEDRSPLARIRDLKDASRFHFICKDEWDFILIPSNHVSL